MLPKEFAELLCCPQCHGSLTEYETPAGLHCVACRLFYPIEEGIPTLLVAEAQSEAVLQVSSPS